MGSIPKGTVGYRKFGGLGWERRLAAMRSIFRVADLVTAPSPTLAERFAGYDAERVAVIENYVPASWIVRRSGDDDGTFTIGWTAGLEHQLDLERIPVGGALQRILDERPIDQAAPRAWLLETPRSTATASSATASVAALPRAMRTP